MKKELYMIVKQHSNNNAGTYTSRTKAADVWDSGSADGGRAGEMKKEIFVAGSGEERV